MDAATATLQRGADVNELYHGSSPLHKVADAEFDTDLSLAQLLIEHGADVNLKDSIGRSPLLIACSSWLKYSEASSEAVCELLVDNGADCNDSDNRGTTPLLAAL